MQSGSLIFGTHKVSLPALIKGVESCSIIDTATGYGNIVEVGIALSKVTCKPKVIAKFNSQDLINFPDSADKLVKDLGKEPEIVLLHSPLLPPLSNSDVLQMFRQRFPQATIGVSNFDIEGVEDLIHGNFKPQIISLEFSPYYQPRALIDFCKRHNIFITGYRCLARGTACKDSLIVHLAEKYNTTPSSILLSWSNIMGVVPIYSSNNSDHIKIFQVKLTSEDVESICKLDKGPSGATCMLKYCQHDIPKL